MKTSFNRYAQYPNVAGIVIVKNILGQSLFVMSTDNIRERIKNTDVHNNQGLYRSWGAGRKIVAEANRGQLVFSYYEMTSADKLTRDTIAEAMDKESLSKQVA